MFLCSARLYFFYWGYLAIDSVWGCQASKGSRTAVTFLIVSSLKRGRNLKQIGNFITFSFELEKWVTHVNKSYGFQPHPIDESLWLIFKIKGSSFHLKGVLLHKLELLSREPSYDVLNQRFQEPSCHVQTNIFRPSV